MSHEKTTEDLNTSVGELANLMNDTFTCCMRNYEALLPYLEKKETKRKIYHKLLQINILLNKLNEELVGLRVEYVTISSCEPERETIQSEGGRKRKTSHVSELGRDETKRIKTELPFLASETAINMQSDKLVSVDTEETKCTQDQNSDMHRVKNIKTEIQESNEVEFSIGEGNLPAAQKSCGTLKNRVTVSFVGDKESASVTDIIVGRNSSDKATDTLKQSENNDESVPLQNVKSRTCNQESCEVSGKVVGVEVGSATSFSYETNRPFKRKESPIAFTTCNNESATLVEGRANSCYKGETTTCHSPIRYDKDNLPIQIPVEQFSAGNEEIKYRFGRYVCSVCYCELPNYKAVNSHVNGTKHRKRMAAKKNGCAIKPGLPENSYERIASLSLFAAVSCSLGNAVAVVSNNCPLESMKDAVKLCDLWKYFPVSFQINKKYFQIHSNQVICLLCNQHVEEDVLNIRIHITRPSHMARIRRLTEFEVAWKNTNRQLLNIPGILNKIIPKIHFTLGNGGFFCKVCDCFCDNDVVLCHLTGKKHGKKLGKKKKL